MCLLRLNSTRAPFVLKNRCQLGNATALCLFHSCRIHSRLISRVGQDHSYAPYITIYFVISLPKIPYVQYTVYLWIWPNLLTSLVNLMLHTHSCSSGMSSATYTGCTWWTKPIWRRTVLMQCSKTMRCTLPAGVCVTYVCLCAGVCLCVL